MAREFERAWADPRHTRFEMPAIDINAVLSEHYSVTEPLTFTRAMLWDVEVRKAASPEIYIPRVVKDGSARSWGRRLFDGGSEYVERVSRQRLWSDPDTYDTVVETAYVDHLRQTVTFLGVPALTDQVGRTVTAGGKQPLFHVEHAVGGTETRPLNLWRIVHLTDRPDEEWLARFNSIPWTESLPEFIEIYIGRDLQVGLRRPAVTRS